MYGMEDINGDEALVDMLQGITRFIAACGYVAENVCTTSRLNQFFR
jgi:hypothetical protein